MNVKARSSVKERIAVELEAGRTRSLDLLAPVSEDDLLRQHSPLMSPLVWDLAHVGNYEEQWLLGEVAAERCAPHLDSVYDAFRHPRKDRPALPMLPKCSTKTTFPSLVTMCCGVSWRSAWAPVPHQLPHQL